MHHIMFDIDGTLVHSYHFDERCYMDAVREVTGYPLRPDWHHYPHITGSGILSCHLLYHGLESRFSEMEKQLREAFTEGIRRHLKIEPVQQVSGADTLIERLKNAEGISLSLATGGWLETALLKLDSAGIDISGIPLASSDDHHIRTEIMRIALDRACVTPEQKITYVGDGEWDRIACSELDWNFVLVGSRTKHHQQLDNLANLAELMMYLP